MISTAGNKEDEARRKKLFIEKALKQVNLTLDDDYSKFHDVKLVKTISDWIVNMEDVKGDCKSNEHRQEEPLQGHNGDITGIERGWTAGNICIIRTRIQGTRS